MPLLLMGVGGIVVTLVLVRALVRSKRIHRDPGPVSEQWLADQRRHGELD